MSVHFRDVSDVLAVLRDVYTYIAITNQNTELGARIMKRIEVILKDNELEHPYVLDHEVSDVMERGYDETILKKLADRKKENK